MYSCLIEMTKNKLRLLILRFKYYFISKITEKDSKLCITLTYSESKN